MRSGPNSFLLVIALSIRISLSLTFHRDHVCDFEPANRCPWKFTNSLELHEQEKTSTEEYKLPINVTYAAFGTSHGTGRPFVSSTNVRSNENFQVVVGMASGRNTTTNHYAYFTAHQATDVVPMIVSPYYQHSSPHCTLTFSYRIIGASGSFLLVSTQLIPFRAISTEEISEAEAEDWLTPTQRKTIPTSGLTSESQSISVPIGEVSAPTRIRIECHAKGDDGKYGPKSDANVECFVDDIRLESCDEHVWQPDVCSMDTQPKRYLCHLHKEQKCIDYADVCDLQEDCPNREDEDNKIHNCKLAPSSARCTFEETRYEAGCENWRIVNMPNSLEMIRLASVADVASEKSPSRLRTTTTMHRTKMPLDKTNNQDGIGHYLVFSTFGSDFATTRKFADSGGLLYSHAMTPLFPRMDPRLNEPSNKMHGTCMVRFFFCHIGSTNFQIILERIKTHYKKVIWTPPRSSLVEPCEWEKATIVLDYQPSEYYLKFGIAKMNNHKAMFLMDDFSMSPNCFLMKAALLESTLPASITLTSCGLSGAVPPTAKQCENPSNVSQRVDGELPTSGRRSFMVDKKTEYRIELFGAAGGALGSQRTKNFGGMVILNHVLDMADEVTFVLGQTGESPCDGRQGLKKNLQQVICGSDKALALPGGTNAVELPGSAGGGATAVFVNGQPIAIAGGGGGLFPSEFADTSRALKNSEGGNSFLYVKHTSKRGQRAAAQLPNGTAVAGAGGSFNVHRSSNTDAGCVECAIMTGQLLSASNAKAGGCPTSALWSSLGGFGGGGASCGPGGGGGAGYHGGTPTLRGNGEGGSSAVFAPVQKFIAKSGINEGNGKIVLRACTLPCVVNATCRFEDPVDGQLPREFCECSNGVRVTGSEPCVSAMRGVVGKVRDSEWLGSVALGSLVFAALDATHPKTLISLGLIVLLLLLLPCLCMIMCRIYSNRRKTKAFNNFHNELQMIVTDPRGMGNGAGAIVTRGSISSNGQLNLITGNPIYQYMDMFDVPHVNRDWCEFGEVIGHGAFGEVRSGMMRQPNEASLKVAIKTLPFESNPEVTHDFQTEAKILSNFSHSNIVRFFGVCFDSHPKFIVLELLEGGDLKNYLRENRPGNHRTGSSSVPQSPATAPDEAIPSFKLMMLDLVQMSLDVAQGCEYLECNKFVHRDIAARNCLLTSKNPINRVVKIADFGMARDIYRNDYYRKGGRAFLPVKWMPPEAFLDGIFTPRTDSWAFGVLLWEIFSMGYTPYPGRQNQEVMQLVVSGGRLDPPIGTPDEIYNFMLRCWETYSDSRPSFTQVVAFLNGALELNSVRSLPIPPLADKLKSPVARSSAPPGDNETSLASQATVSTLVTSSMTESTTTSSYESMPTKGAGVTHNLCAPYETKRPHALGELSRIASEEDSGDSHDESTLHDSCSVKQSPYKISRASSGNQLGLATTAPTSSTNSSFKRLFRRSMDKSGQSQPLIPATTVSSASEGDSAPSRASDGSGVTGTSLDGKTETSTPLPSQLL